MKYISNALRQNLIITTEPMQYRQKNWHIKH
jgi:hypothetical protein